MHSAAARALFIGVAVATATGSMMASAQSFSLGGAMPGAVAGSLSVGAGPGPSVARVALPAPAVRFDANRGQSEPEVRFMSRGRDYSLALASDHIAVGLQGSVVRMRPVGANAGASVEGESPQPGLANYLIGADRSKWTTGVPGYGKVRYREIYPGIDLVFYGGKGRLEYDFVVRPGADPKIIEMAVEGGRKMTLNARGDLAIKTPTGSLHQQKPKLYQLEGGRKRAVRGGFIVRKGSFSFRVGAYDRSKPLVIDPILEFSTQLGGAGDDGAHGVAVDAKGNAYVTGWTASLNFPKKGAARAFSDPGGTQTIFCSKVGRGGEFAGGGGSLAAIGLDRPPFQGGGGCGDAFVVKFDPSGRLVYSTYLGGKGADAGVAIAADSAGAAYVAGHTASQDFPVKNAAQAVRGGPIPDGFVVKLSPEGADVAYSTFLGGSSFDSANAIAVDSRNKVYVAGEAGIGFPTKGAIQASVNGPVSDAFVAKIDPDASGPASMVYSTLLGGPARDVANGIAVDNKQNAYVTGLAGRDFPTKNALQTKNGGCASALGTAAGGCPDAFVAKLNPAGSALEFSTNLGGKGDDAGMGIAVDASGGAYVTGTAGAGFPIKNGAHKKVNGESDAFIAKIGSSGKSLEYASYLGGTGADSGNAVALDKEGHAYLAGTAMSVSSSKNIDLPVKDPVQSAHRGGRDSQAISASFDTSKSGADSLMFSTYMGGTGNDFGNGIALTDQGAAFFAGATESSSDFPSLKAIQPAGGGDSDAFLAKISFEESDAPVVRQINPRSGPPAGGSQLVVSGEGFEGVRSVKFGDVATSQFKVSPNGTRLVVNTPAHDAGSVTVSLVTGSGASSPGPDAQFVFAPGTWTPTAPPAEARSWPAAVLLENGNVLLAGGCLERRAVNDACAKATDSAEIYDSKAKGWAPTGKMTIARQGGFAAILLPGGKVLVVGGSGPGGETLTKAEIYDPQAGQWKAVADFPGVTPGAVVPGSREQATGSAQGTRQFTATLLKTGKVLVVGDGPAALFDPVTLTWSPTGDRALVLPLDHTATLLNDGRVLVSEDDSYVYDPATAKWAATSKGEISRFSKTASLLPDGKVLAVGGRPNYEQVSADVEIYDPEAPGEGGVKGTWKPTRKLAAGRFGHAATVLADGRVLVAGGGPATGGRLDSAEIYDPKAQAWTSAGVMNDSRGRGVTATILKDGDVLVTGSGGKTADLYDPSPEPDRRPLSAPKDGPEQAKNTAAAATPWMLIAAIAGAGVLAIAMFLLARRRKTES